MTKNHFNIEDPELRSWLVGGLGAGLGVIIQRFFKNKDSHAERLRRLEMQHRAMEVDIKTITTNLNLVTKKLEAMYFNLENKEGYVHIKFHEILNKINVNNLKESIVDDVDRKFDLILEKLGEHEKITNPYEKK